MWLTIVRGIIAGAIVVGVTEFSKRSPRAGAVLLTLPLVSILAFIMAWNKHRDFDACQGNADPGSAGTSVLPAAGLRRKTRTRLLASVRPRRPPRHHNDRTVDLARTANGLSNCLSAASPFVR